ncbi:MAG: zinc-ribbon domain-containing protein [Clostridia bacterium]|nr:zinc-ribbon domain-containing protein [Clostridia bacterium]MBQ4073229.1 zinc-ribbon domain-containing protein [Clostridia bacterium]
MYGGKKEYWWKCSKCGHEWQAQIIKRNKGQGCPECYKNSFKNKQI